MKIKITKSVIHRGKIHALDSIHDLPTREAGFLIEGGFAAEHNELAAQQQQQQQQPPTGNRPPGGEGQQS